jgi:hypothetical protein
MTTRTFQFTVAAASGPSWFTTGQSVKTWKAIPGVNTVNDAWAGQTTLTVYGNPPGICRAWNGACVDQVRGEYLLVANGGHEDYAWNEVYAISLRTDSPKWYRLVDHSPSSAVNPALVSGSSTSSTPAGQALAPNKYAAMYADGRMRSVHGWYNTHFANGKAWLVTQGSPTGVGFSTPHAWSFNRSYVNGLGDQMPTAYGQAAQRWENNAGPWQWRGFAANGNLSTTAQGIPAWDDSPGVALDPVTGIIHTLHGSDQGDNQVSGYGTLNTNTGAITHTAYTPGATALGAAVVAYDPQWDGVAGDPNGTCRWRLFICIRSDGVLYVRKLVAGTWATPSVSATTIVAQTGVGAVYHAASKSMICADPVRSLNGNVYKVRIPTDGTFNYTPQSVWTVTPIAPASGSASLWTGTNAGLGGGYTYGKLRLVQNIGDGHDGIVLVNETSLPTYVYKLPLTEIS